MGKKQLILLAAAVLAPVLFFLLPANRTWIWEKPISYWNDFTVQHGNLDPEHRKILRYDSAYIYSKQIAAFFEQKGITPSLVLVPASRYFEQYHIHYSEPQAVVFYYYTGLKTVRPAAADAIKAHWYVSVKEGKLAVDSVTNPAILPGMIQALKKIDSSLYE